MHFVLMIVLIWVLLLLGFVVRRLQVTGDRAAIAERQRRLRIERALAADEDWLHDAPYGRTPDWRWPS